MTGLPPDILAQMAGADIVICHGPPICDNDGSNPDRMANCQFCRREFYDEDGLQIGVSTPTNQ